MNQSRKGISHKKSADRMEHTIRDADNRATMAQITATLAIMLAMVDFIIHFI